MLVCLIRGREDGKVGNSRSKHSKDQVFRFLEDFEVFFFEVSHLSNRSIFWMFLQTSLYWFVF